MKNKTLTSTVKKLTIVVKLQSSWYIFHVHVQYTIDNSESLQMYYIIRFKIYRYIHMYIPDTRRCYGFHFETNNSCYKPDKRTM